MSTATCMLRKENKRCQNTVRVGTGRARGKISEEACVFVSLLQILVAFARQVLSSTYLFHRESRSTGKEGGNDSDLHFDFILYFFKIAIEMDDKKSVSFFLFISSRDVGERERNKQRTAAEKGKRKERQVTKLKCIFFGYLFGVATESWSPRRWESCDVHGRSNGPSDCFY